MSHIGIVSFAGRLQFYIKIKCI